MAFGSPSITPPNRIDLRAIQSAIVNTRRRIEIIEAALASVASSGGTSASTSASIASLQAQIAGLSTSAENAALAALLAGADGLVVQSSGMLRVRTLQAGVNIAITYPDGVSGDPVISSTAPAGGDTILYDDAGRALLTDTGHALLTGA